MKLFLGIDGGQSSTTTLIGDDSGRTLGAGRGGPCNHVKTDDGRARFVHAISESVGMACRAAGLDPTATIFTSACGGFSGGPADKQGLLGQMLRADRLHVTDDAVIALAGANHGQPAVITIAGTGSIACGRNSEGRFARVGGWGYVFGDEGGGFDITRQALRAALRFEEGWGPATALRDVLLAETGSTNVNELMHRFYAPEFSRQQIASFARLVDQAGVNGDAVARNILFNAAQELATITAAVREQLFEDEEPVFVAYIGGVFRSTLLFERFRMIVELADGARLGEPRMGPAAGALIEAYRLAGLEVIPTNLPEVEK